MSSERNIGAVHDRAQIVHTLARAFQDDPALSWIIPDAAQRKIRLPRMFDFIVPLDLRDGFALGSSSGEAATLWRSPGKPHTGLLDMVMMLPAVFHTFGTAALRGLAVSEAMDAHHPKGITYFYLRYAGVLPEHQGKGWGGAAIRAGLERQRLRRQQPPRGVVQHVAQQSTVVSHSGSLLRSPARLPRGTVPDHRRAPDRYRRA